MRKFTYILTFHLLMLLSSCSKHRYPYVKIITPTDGLVFNAPDVINISANLSDSDALVAEVLVVTKVNSTNDTIINFHDRRFMNFTYHLKDSFISEPNTQYKIVVTGYGHGKRASDSVFVKTN